MFQIVASWATVKWAWLWEHHIENAPELCLVYAADPYKQVVKWLRLFCQDKSHIGNKTKNNRKLLTSTTWVTQVYLCTWFYVSFVSILGCPTDQKKRAATVQGRMFRNLVNLTFVHNRCGLSPVPFINFIIVIWEWLIGAVAPVVGQCECTNQKFPPMSIYIYQTFSLLNLE